MEHSQALEVMTVLADYYGKEMSESQATLWGVELLAFDERDAMAAARVAGTFYKFMPSLAEFILLMKDESKARRQAALGRQLEGMAWDAPYTGPIDKYHSPADDGLSEHERLELNTKRGWFVDDDKPRDAAERATKD
jgi:hypothetical protein